MDAQTDWEFFRAQLPSNFRELAIERGFIKLQPPQLKTKVTDIEPVLRLLLYGCRSHPDAVARGF
jgi:hypothetical protein